MPKTKFLIKETGKYGKGAFAQIDIKKGQIIHRFNGSKIDVKEVVERVNSGAEYIDDPLQIGKRTYIDLDATSRSFNHSCDPNAALRSVGVLFAIKNIKPDEEITYDYSATIAPTEWKMKCKCGSKKCRRILGDVFTIPISQRNYYKKEGAFQSYMSRLLNQAKNRNEYKLPAYELQALEKLNAKK